MQNIIEIEHLTKRFGEITAVDDLSFRVKEGELFAFLGVNGAGKSTTISIMCGQLAKDSGRVVVNGMDIDNESGHIRHPRFVQWRTDKAPEDCTWAQVKQ